MMYGYRNEFGYNMSSACSQRTAAACISSHPVHTIIVFFFLSFFKSVETVQLSTMYVSFVIAQLFSFEQ